MPKGGCPSKYRLEVHKKVIEILGVVAELKRKGNHNFLEHRIDAVAIVEGSDVQRTGDARSTDSVERFLSNMAREKPLRFTSKDITRFTSNLVEHLGRGGYGEVYKGQFPNGVQIAVKVLKDNVRDVVKKQFMAEVGTMGRTYHRNLVRLYGFCFEANMKALVYEFVENGSLDKILYDNPLKLEWEKLYDIATETAKGLSYLHENCHKRIIHCDIKPGNVLIDSKLCPKVADFGLAKLCNRDLSHFTLTQPRGTPGYAAPEVSMSLVTYRCDVYSFGIMLFEILGMNKDLRQGQKSFRRQVWEKFDKGKFEEIRTYCGIKEKNREKTKTLSMVALLCVQYVPKNRPSMSEVVKILEGEIKAPNPPNPFPDMASSSTESTYTKESTECLSSFVSSEVDITSKGNLIRPKVPISFSEDSPVSAEWQVELKSPLPEPTVSIEKKIQETKVITVVLMVYMHCEACAQEVAKYLRKMKGVETASTNLERSQVTVKGKIDPDQLVEYVYKKTNKRAMIEKVEEPIVIQEAAVKRKQEVEFVIETKSESKTNKHGTKEKTELEKADEEKAIAKTERRKKQEKTSKRVVTVINESKMEEEKEIVLTKLKKNQEEESAAEDTAKPDPRKSGRERVRKMHQFQNVGAHMKEIQEEKGNDTTLDQKVMNSKADNKDMKTPGKEKLIEEGGRKMERNEDVYGYIRRNNGDYHGLSGESYASQLFSDDNPNAMCSIL